MANGDAIPEVRDGLAAARFIAQIEEAAVSQRDQGEHIEAMILLINTVRENVTPEQFESIGQAMSRDPMLRAIAAGRPD